MLADHEAHEAAARALASADATIAHVAAESYAVLTRLPAPLRVAAQDAAAILRARLPGRYLALGPAEHARSPERLARAGVIGGATYDGLIALTALEHDVELLSRDSRAARAYRALGVRFELIGA